VSTANVGQLAADVLIASLRLERIGVFDPKYFIPVVGAREDGRPGITTPYECMSDLALLNSTRFMCEKYMAALIFPLLWYNKDLLF
jgi:predicted ATP-grasp superfamily ATP-dependent carboligase